MNEPAARFEWKNLLDKILRLVLGGNVFIGTTPSRSKTMASIRATGNKTTELKVRMGLVRAGISGWTLHSAGLAGKPDFVFDKAKIAIFVDGCFWHFCPRCGHIPHSRSKFWHAKLQRTKERDRHKTRTLRAMGFRVLRIWEHQLKTKRGVDKAIQKVAHLLAS